MYHHLLDFAKDDFANLKQRYRTLVQKLEPGNDIEKHLIDEIADAMQVILKNQDGLLPFWQKVQQHPTNHYHLHLAHADKELLNLPWQLAIDNKQYPFIHITKSSVAINELPVYQPHPGPLRILVMISSPADLQYSKRLSYEEEEDIILKAMSPLFTTAQVQVHFTEDGSLATLKNKLQSSFYHIVYFSGHGIYKNNTGYLQLENPITLESEEISARQLAQALKDSSLEMPPLIVLSSCQTAQGNMTEGFRGVADEIIHEGVPAVIAMAFSIRDQFNIIFTGHLYEQLAHKHPLTEAYFTALQDMRIKEQQELRETNRENYFPSQSIIPQLYISQQVNHIVDWETMEKPNLPLDPLFTQELLPHSPDYRFVGRRQECASLLKELINGKPVSITGQAGLGKTALAEFLVKRLIVQDASYYCFAFNETTIGIDSIATRFLHYLKENDQPYYPSYEARQWENSIQQLDFLLSRVTKLCKPVWIFDNLDNCQQQGGGPLKNEYRDWINYVHAHLSKTYPLIFIGRFEIPELKEVFAISLNQVPFVDFYRKCIQLDLKYLHTQLLLPELADVVSLLYKIFGGSYRTLELLNELYVNNPDRTLALLQKIAGSEHARESAKALMKDVHAKLQTFSRQMVLSELINSLTREEQKTLNLLLYFKRPVLSLALEMQEPGKNFDADLQRLKNVTLIEEQIDRKTGNKLYHVAPLVKNSIEGIDLPLAYFVPEYAGDYYQKSFKALSLFNELEEAVELYEYCDNIPKLNEVGVILTNNYHRMGLHDAVLHYGTWVEEIAGDKTHGEILNDLGLTYLKFGDYEKALTYFTKFSIHCKLEKDDKRLGMAYNSIGQAYLRSGEFETGMNWMERSIELSKACQDDEQIAVTLNNMGLLYCEMKEYEKAMKVFQESLKIREKNNDPLGQIKVLNNICRIYSDRGQHQKDRETLEKALTIAVEIGNKHFQGIILNNLGYAFKHLKDPDAALTCFQNNLAVSQSIDDEEETGKAFWAMGMLYKEIKKYDEAIDCLTKGSLLLQKFDYKYVQLDLLYQLGIIHIFRGDAAESLPLLQMALTEFLELKSLNAVAQTLYYIGDAYLHLNDIKKGINNLEQSLSISKSVEDNETESMALIRLEQAYALKGKTQKLPKKQGNSGKMKTQTSKKNSGKKRK